MTKQECLDILDSLDCGRAEDDIEECKDVLRAALLSGSFLLQVNKTLEEIKAVGRTADIYGLDLMNEGRMAGDTAFGLHSACAKLEEVSRVLTLGTQFTGSTGYTDYKDKGLAVLERLCYAAAVLNNMEAKLKRLGLVMEHSAFVGHYAESFGACAEAVACLCGTVFDMEAVRVRLSTITLDDYMNAASDLYCSFSDAVRPNIAAVADIWPNSYRL